MSLSLDELAQKHGQIAPETVDGGRYKWQHRVADQIHGWTVHNYHHQADTITLSDSDYLAALRAAETGLTPHEPARAKAPDYKARAKALADAAALAAANPMPSAPVHEPAAAADDEPAEAEDATEEVTEESEQA
jgi:hypothetical protein